MSQTGPIQPFVGGGGVQENFRAQVDHVLSYNPDAPPQLVKRRLNTRLREVLDRHMWGGLLVRGEIAIPAAYSTGLCTATRGSDTVVGNGAAWPVADMANTTLSTAITAINEYQDVFPVSMSGINAGDWLLFDDGLATQEAVLVISVSSDRFKAKPTMLHSVGATITRSSLSRRQWRVGMTKSFYNIRAVTTAQELIVDLPYAHTSQTNANYQIVQAYVNMGQNLRMIWSAVNCAQGWKIKLNMPQEVLDSYDTWRTGQGFAYMLSDYIPDEIGRFQYEIYPTPSFEQGIPYLAYRSTPDMVEDEDTPPPAIPSHLLVHGAIADCMLYNRKSPYYDPQLAQIMETKFESDLINAVMMDDNLYLTNLQWCYNQYPFQNSNFGGASYRQNHDV